MFRAIFPVRALPLLALIVGSVIMYFASIDLNTMTRADACFIIMAILATFHLYLAIRWYYVGFQTFKNLKKHQETATEIIEKMSLKLSSREKDEVVTELIDEQIQKITSKVRKLTQESEN